VVTLVAKNANQAIVGSGGACIWQQSAARESVLCWCIWQESGLSHHEKVFTFSLLYKNLSEKETIGAWYNNELYGLYREQDPVSYIKFRRMQWAGHVGRREVSDPAKEVMEQQLYGTQRAGRPKLRWVESVAQDARNMGINNWQKATQDRKRWRRLLA
jgi:hypothetical protein